MIRRAALALTLACGPGVPPPVLETITPPEVVPGERVQLTGAGLDDAALTLVPEAGPPTPLARDAEGLTVPASTPPGRYGLRATGPGGDSAAIPLVVFVPDLEPPCAKRYALKVETSRTQRKVAIERTFAHRPSERLVFFDDDLVALEATATAHGDGLCHAMWLHTADGRRVLLADDPARDLGVVAAALATALDLPPPGPPPTPTPTP